MAVNPRPTPTAITAMKPADLDDVVGIERLSFRRPWSRQMFAEELGRQWAHVDVLREDGEPRVVGFINYWLVRDEIHILNLATHPDCRRRSYGAQLLLHVIEFARRHDCRYLTLEVRRSNHAALRLYRRYGFRQVGVRPKYYVEDNEDAIVMLLELW